MADNREEKSTRSLLARAELTFGDKPVAETVGRVRAIIGISPADIPAAEEDAEAALEAMRSGRTPTPKQAAALELMIKMMRPALLSRRGQLDRLPEYNDYNADFVKSWDDFRPRAQPLLYSVGRIDRTSDGEEFGTGFLVAPDLLVTNRHVLAQISFGAEALEPGQAEVRFGQELNPPAQGDLPPVPVESVAAVHPRLDMALLRLFGDVQAPHFDIDPKAPEEGTSVAVIGYPFKDSARNPVFMEAIYGGDYGVKRAAPGHITGSEADTLFHDCSTLGGNSGSPLLALDSARVVGLHKSGMFMYRNEAVGGRHLLDFVASVA